MEEEGESSVVGRARNQALSYLHASSVFHNFSVDAEKKSLKYKEGSVMGRARNQALSTIIPTRFHIFLGN